MAPVTINFMTDIHASFEETTLLLLLILLSAKWMGFLAKKAKMPELVGELLAGVLIGNLYLLKVPYSITESLQQNAFLQYASELGVILLLFSVGLESSFRDLIKVGWNSLNVGCVGVVLPVVTGVAVATISGLSEGLGAWFVGATLAATSVGITAKVLGDAGLIKAKSSQTILGAAIIDDILGLLILAVLAGVATTGHVEVGVLLQVLMKSFVFFTGCLIFHRFLISYIVRISSLNTSAGVWTAFALVLALVLSYFSSLAGLAPIIGAFMAGLILEDTHFAAVTQKMSTHQLTEAIRPLTDMLLPIFFVGIGAQVKLEIFASVENILMILAILAVAVLGKLAAGFVVRGKGYDKLGIGIGMVPRGEVGLIFASYAFSHGVLSAQAYSVLVFVVLLTTVLGPLLLKSRLKYF